MANILERAWKWLLLQPGWLYIVYMAFGLFLFFVFVYHFRGRDEERRAVCPSNIP